MDERVKKLLILAENFMRQSKDPVHDLSHVKRVVSHCRSISKESSLSNEQYQALILSAWWHDAGRTLNKKASFVLMPFVDDTLSALMLWYWTIRFGLFGSVVGMATRIIFCKSMGTGTVLTKILLRKKNRILLDILKDADALDLLNVERSKVICNLAESSIKYRIAYRIMIRWIFVTNQFEFRTQSAKELFIQILRNFLEWIKQTEVYEWHLNFIPKHKLDKNIAIGELKLIQFSTII